MKKLLVIFFLVASLFVNVEARGTKGSAYGKYYNLKQTLTCYRDKSTYGRYRDYGYWGGGPWCGQYGKSGYWVYSYPKWYVWGNKDSRKPVRATRSSAYGKYRVLRQTLTCRRDERTYGSYRDYGYWGGGSWCGQYGKAGYWVYSYPKWYIWKYRN